MSIDDSSLLLKYFVSKIFPIVNDSVPLKLKVFFLQQLQQSSEEEQFKNGFNPQDCSNNIRVMSKHLKFFRLPILRSTDCIRTKIGYNKGLHIWEISWPPETRGTHPIIGVSKKSAPLYCEGYVNLIGSNSDSWGWNLNQLSLHHNGIRISGYPLLSNNVYIDVKQYKKFLLILDFFKNTVSFMTKNEAFNPHKYYYLGVAFKLAKVDDYYYPIIQSVHGQSSVKIKYIGGYQLSSVPKLKELCKLIAIDNFTFEDIKHIPNSLQKFVIQ
jgi:hypothetical protein